MPSTMLPISFSTIPQLAHFFVIYSYSLCSEWRYSCICLPFLWCFSLSAIAVFKFSSGWIFSPLVISFLAFYLSMVLPVYFWLATGYFFSVQFSLRSIIWWNRSEVHGIFIYPNREGYITERYPSAICWGRRVITSPSWWYSGGSRWPSSSVP